MLVSSPMGSSADITVLMVAFIGIRAIKIQTEDNIVVGTAHIIILESVKVAFLIKADFRKSCRSRP